MVDNPFYCTLHLTQLPSWVKSPALYSSGSLSSLVVVFEDPDGKILKGLLAQRHLFAFGHVGKLTQRKQKSHEPRGLYLRKNPEGCGVNLFLFRDLFLVWFNSIYHTS